MLDPCRASQKNLYEIYNSRVIWHGSGTTNTVFIDEAIAVIDALLQGLSDDRSACIRDGHRQFIKNMDSDWCKWRAICLASSLTFNAPSRKQVQERMANIGLDWASGQP